MGRRYLVQLEHKPYYCCSDCNTHLALRNDLISEAFRGRTGTAWLFHKVVNVYTGHVEDRMMTTGLHTIADIFCKMCHVNLGWKYEHAFEQAQKYKQGKYILERDLVRLIDDETHSDSGDQEDFFFGTPIRSSQRNRGSRQLPTETGNNRCINRHRRETATVQDTAAQSRPRGSLLVVDSRSEPRLRHVERRSAPDPCAYSSFFPPPHATKTRQSKLQCWRRFNGLLIYDPRDESVGPMLEDKNIPVPTADHETERSPGVRSRFPSERNMFDDIYYDAVVDCSVNEEQGVLFTARNCALQDVPQSSDIVEHHFPNVECVQATPLRSDTCLHATVTQQPERVTTKQELDKLLFTQPTMPVDQDKIQPSSVKDTNSIHMEPPATTPADVQVHKKHQKVSQTLTDDYTQTSELQTTDVPKPTAIRCSSINVVVILESKPLALLPNDNKSSVPESS